MARPLRVNLQNGWYHVYARGVDRMRIFKDDRDRNHFLGLLGTLASRYRLLIHAYVLMGNHFHLIVQTPDANLSRAMHWLNLSWAAWFKAKHGRTGPVFQRPFGSKPIEDGKWAYKLSAYVHLNPLRIQSFSLDRRSRAAANRGMVRVPTKEQVERRLKALRAYRWSSYRSYANYSKEPEWLHMEDLLGRASEEAEKQKQEYRRQIQSLLRQGGDVPLREKLRDAVAIGSVEFVKMIKDAAASGALNRETSQKRSIRARVSIDEVIGAVEDIRGESWEDFGSRHGDPGKAMVMWLAREYTGKTLGEIGDRLDGRDYAAVSIMLKRFGKKREEQDSLRKQCEEAVAKLIC